MGTMQKSLKQKMYPWLKGTKAKIATHSLALAKPRVTPLKVYKVDA